MARTPQQEAEYQQLGQQLGFFAGPSTEDPNAYGTAGFAGRTLANVLPGAVNKIIQPTQALLGMDERTTVPDFFLTRAPQGITESVIGGAGQLAQYLPAIIATEGGAAAGLEGLGVSSGAARIAGAGAGFAFPSADEGPEAAASQGAVGALQAAARPLGWKGKLAAGLVGGGLGYYEGQKTSQQAGIIQGGLNFLGPTLIDPAVDRILGANHAASTMGRTQEAQTTTPNQPSGPIPFQVAPDGPKDIAGLQLAPQGSPTPTPALPFYDAANTSGLQLQPPDGAITGIGGGQPIPGQPSSAPLKMPTEMSGLDFGMQGTDTAFAYGRGTDPYDAFASLQRPPIIGNDELFHRNPNNPQGRIFADDNITGLTGKDSGFTYGRGTDPYNVFSDVDRIQSQAPLSPVESAARAKFDAENASRNTPSEPTPVTDSGYKVKAPEGQSIPSPRMAGPHVIASAVQKGDTVYVSGQHNAPHEKIGIEHGLTSGEDSVPESQRGFLTQEKSGQLGYATRKRAAKIALKSGQLKEPTEFLKSESPWGGDQQMAKPIASTGPEAIKNGGTYVHWTDDGMPLDVTATDVQKNRIKYTEHNFMTGESSEKVASLQEFDRLQQHPSDRPAAQISKEPERETTVSKWVAKRNPMKRLVETPTDGPPPNPPKPGESPAPASGQAASDRVKVKGKYGWEEAKVLGREGNTLHVEVDDPIFGSRRTSVLKDDTLPVASLQTEAPKSTVPFQDVQGARTQLDQADEPYGGEGGMLGTPTENNQLEFLQARKEAPEVVDRAYDPHNTKTVADLVRRAEHELDLWDHRNEGEEPYIRTQKEANKVKQYIAKWKDRGEENLLGSQYEGHGPTNIGKTIPGNGKAALTLEEGLKKLPPEAASIIGEIFNRIKAAAGKDVETFLNERMPGAKGGMYELSGRVGLNLQWINAVVKNWNNMSEASRGNALMRVAALFGHEVTHVAQKFGERTGLTIGGEPLLTAVTKRVDELSSGQRMYIAEQMKAAKGEMSGGVSAYLAGDTQAAYNFYKKFRPNLTMDQAKELAAGELMAEVGSVELSKRMKVDGLPTGLRTALDRFKQVLMNVVDWFRGNGHDSGVAALQSLSDIANKMFDHFSVGSEEQLSKAFPARSFPSETPAPTAPLNPVVTTNNSTLLKSEVARLGLRATVGGVAGGIIVPAIGGNQTTTAEGVILGGIAGLFGPAIVKRLLSGNFPEEIAEAFKASKGNPLKTMAAIMGNQSLRDMGLAARYGWTGEANTMSKMVRLVEREFNLNLDPKMKALIEEARGQGTMVLATVQDALDKIRWYKPNADTQTAVEAYFTGKLSKDAFMKLMDNPELQTYGQSMVAAREGMTTLTQMFASGMSKSNFKDQLIQTADSYLGRFYSAYKEGKFNMEAFEGAKKDLMAKYPEYSDQMADDILREHMREVQANRNMFGGRRGNSGQKIDSGLMSRRLATEEEIEGQKVVVGSLEHDPYSPDYLKEKGKLDWMESHKITDNWRDWLGEYKNPTERLIYTFQKVHPSAISAKAFSFLDDRINSNGLRFSYTPTGLAQARTLIDSELTKAAHPDDIARLQNQLKELSGYGALPQGSAYGRLAGKWVDRFTRDEVNTYATPFKWMEQPILRGISSFNNMIKISRTALNPLTTVRNYIQMPMFALIAKTMPGDIAEAFNSIHRLKDDTYRTMLERHIIGADYVSAELSKGPGHILSGNLDSDIAVKLAKYGMDKALKFYQQPDLLLRAGSFIAARRRFANEAMESGAFASLQDAMKHSSVIDKAAEYTNRYTMNYSAVPRIVKIGRQLPFVSLFVSYTSEMTRILKNLTMDAISPGADSAGRMHAITVLGGMAAIPAMLTAMTEGSLSKKDQADWEKVKTLSPDYARGRFRLPIDRDAQGRFHYLDITNLLPADSYSQMIKSLSSGDYKAAWAANPIVSLQNTPLLNMATEQISGQDLQTGRQIVGGFGRVKEILKETLPPIIPPGYEGERLQNAFSTNDQGTQGLTNMKSGVQYRPSDVIANYLTGVRGGNVELATVQRSAISNTQQQLTMQQAILKDVLNTNVGQAQKNQAIANYKKTEEELMLQLHTRLGQ